MKLIHHSCPSIGLPEYAVVKKVLDSCHLAGGPELAKLESAFKAYTGHTSAAGVSSGTAALYYALDALKVHSGDKVMVPSYSCTALLNAVYMAGAQPVLADVDPSDGNMNYATVKEALVRGTKAIIVPHMFGFPANVKDIVRCGLPVIEDCAQCVGALINGRKAGSSSEIAVFSFYATKLLSAGEGGLVAVTGREYVRRLTDKREYDKKERYIPSFNFKLSDIHAGIALAQFKKLPAMIRRRRAIALAYRRYLSHCPGIILPETASGVKPVYYRFVVKTESPDKLIRRMSKYGIECARPVYKPLHHYLNRPDFPGTEEIFSQALSLPIYPSLTNRDTARIITSLLRATER